MTLPPRPSAGLSESPIESLAPSTHDETEASRPRTFVVHEAHPRGELPLASGFIQIIPKERTNERKPR